MKTKIFLVAAAWIVAAAPLADSETMKAIVAHEYGGPGVLRYEDVPRPEPKEDEILVRVIAAGVNPVDGMIRSGMFAKDKKLASPMILGGDIAGVVEKTGARITKFKKGDSIYAYLSLKNNGGYAEYAVAKEKEAALKLGAGQSVLIHGGSGGVGMFAIQIAKARGAKVFATASTPNQEFLKELGADVAIDYTKQKFEDIAKDVDVVLDSVGGDTLARSYGVVKKGGFIATLVSDVDQIELDKRGIRGESISVKPNSQELDEIGKLIDAKKIRVIVSQTFPLADAVKAQEQAATGHTRGKIVLKVADEPK